jgi:RNA polymerase sigma-70 factor (ECF subfamily)
MSNVAAQDAAAQRALAVRLIARVKRVCGMFLRQSADIEDAAQESLLEILKAAGSYRGESSIERWAGRIAVRTALRAARAARRSGERVDGTFSPDDLPTMGQDHEANQMLTTVKEYVDRLPETRRSVIVLRCVLGYSVEEVSELIGVSPNTVKDRLLHGRQEIRQMIRRENAMLQTGTSRG